mmetsp:Transcript_11837/g.33979  ORF Transcript_11837/g.33979 Transcript_11837/m.33979 type:complete len:103 (+) Transcript_11837:382-690(+)
MEIIEYGYASGFRRAAPRFDAPASVERCHKTTYSIDLDSSFDASELIWNEMERVSEYIQSVSFHDVGQGIRQIAIATVVRPKLLGWKKMVRTLMRCACRMYL